MRINYKTKYQEVVKGLPKGYVRAAQVSVRISDNEFKSSLPFSSSSNLQRKNSSIPFNHFFFFLHSQSNTFSLFRCLPLEVCLHRLKNSQLHFPGAQLKLLAHQIAHLCLETCYTHTQLRTLLEDLSISSNTFLAHSVVRNLGKFCQIT